MFQTVLDKMRLVGIAQVKIRGQHANNVRVASTSMPGHSRAAHGPNASARREFRPPDALRGEQMCAHRAHGEACVALVERERGAADRLIDEALRSQPARAPRRRAPRGALRRRGRTHCQSIQSVLRDSRANSTHSRSREAQRQLRRVIARAP
jgi:hypothetical protein